MPSLEEGEERESCPQEKHDTDTAIESTESLPQAANDIDNAPQVEGAAHSDEHKSHRSGSEEASSKGGSRSLPPALLGDFDVLRFKNRFLEVVEELRMRRVIDAENEERIKELVTENRDLRQKLDEEQANYEVVIQGHTQSEQELKRSHEEQLKQAEDDVTRSKLAAESKEQEVKVLKDEIRSLHLSQYNFEKKIQEQERQLQLHASSKENYLTQVNQLEQNCLSVSREANEVIEQMERLEANVKGAFELHKKLEYVNEHQKCELKQSQAQLEQCRRELLEAKVKISFDKSVSPSRGEGRKTKCSDQDLRMQIDLNRQLQEQLSALREEHQSILQQLKEAHALLERHIENSAKLSASEAVISEEMRELKEANKNLQRQLVSIEEIHAAAVDSHSKEIAKSSEKCCDLERRLKALQGDYASLQASHDRLEEDRLSGEREIQATREEVEKLKSELKTCESEARCMKEEKESLSEKIGWLQLKFELELVKQRMSVPTEMQKVESDKGVELSEILSPATSIVLPALQGNTTGDQECLGAASSSAKVASVPEPPPLSPVFSPDVVVASPCLRPSKPPSPHPIHSGCTENMPRDVKQDSLDHPPVGSPPQTDDPLSTTLLLKGKRTAVSDNGNEECKDEQPSQVKKQKLDPAAAICDIPEGITKVADSPIIEEQVNCDDKANVNSDTPADEEQVKQEGELVMVEDVKQESTKLESGCAESEASVKEEGGSGPSQASSKNKERECDGSEGVAKPGGSNNEGNQLPGGKDCKQDELSLMFSDEEDEIGDRMSRLSRDRMISSQMSRQIDRVQVFLKLERLKRPKK